MAAQDVYYMKPEDRLAQLIKCIVGERRLDLKLSQPPFKYGALRIGRFRREDHAGDILRLSLLRFRVLRFSHARTPTKVAQPSKPMATITLP